MPGYSLPLTESRIIADLMKRQQGHSTALGGGAATIQAERDRWALSGTPGTSYTLSYLPLDQAVWVFLNGLELDEGTDYTCDYSTGVITTSTTLTSGDVITARYLTTGDLAAAKSWAFTDDFNRADSTTTLGASWTAWAAPNDATAQTSTWGISSNQAYCAASPVNLSTALEGFAYIDGGGGDGTLQVTLSTLDTSALSVQGIGFRIDPQPNFSRSFFVAAYDQVYYAAPNTGMTGVFTYSSPFTSGDVMKVVLLGSSIEVYKNGTMVGSGSSSANLTATKHGMAATNPSPYTGTARFDDFSWAPA